MQQNPENWQAAVAALETKLGYTFHDTALITEALTHPSYHFEQGLDYDNQRLEFLGDAVLGFYLADRIYRMRQDHPEGMLTILRASIASGAALAARARGLGLGAALLLGRGEAMTGGRDRESDLSDAMEAVLGALYLDGGIAAVSGVLDRLLAEEIAHLGRDPWMDNPKGKLQSITQKRYRIDPVYTLIEERGPKHEREFEVLVEVGDIGKAQGVGGTKRAAQAAAAAALLRQLGTGE